MGAFFYFILFGLVVAVIGGVLQGIHNSKRQSPPPLNKKFSLGGSITREQLSHIQAENRKRGTALQHCVELNNRGIAYEKMGKIEDAIATYEINISIGYKGVRGIPCGNGIPRPVEKSRIFNLKIRYII